MGIYVEEEDCRDYNYKEVLKPHHRSEVGGWMTTGLLWESTQNDKTRCIFTLKDTDYITDDNQYLYSLRRLFMEEGDITEYSFAIKVFGSWRAWELFKKGSIMRANLKEWQEELEIKSRSAAVKNVAQMQFSDKESVAIQAAKYIAEEGWRRRPGAGKPSKREKERMARIEAGVSGTLDEDLRRITEKTY